MKDRVFVASFAKEGDLLRAISAIRRRKWPIVEAYTPYPVHGLDRALGLPRTHLSAVCFVCGLLGVILALGFQFWSTGWNWPLNVGGQPWNSLPAFVPVTFEAMVLFAGMGLFLAWLVRCRLYPGKSAVLAQVGQTDDRFVLVFREPLEPSGAEEVRQLLVSYRPVSLEER
jgi:hypothetical protein